MKENKSGGAEKTDYVKTALLSLLSLLVLLVLTKLTGAKQVSQLSMFDYINGITIGSIAAELATELENPHRPLLAMIIYGLCSFCISVLCSRSVRLRRMLFGKSILLMRNGKLYRNGLRKARLDTNEFLMQCRADGYFDISEIKAAFMEPNGKISILPFSEKRAVTPEELAVSPSEDEIFFTVISEGNILPRNLSASGFDCKWLKNELKRQSFKSEREIFLGLLSSSGVLNAYPYMNKSSENDFFE